VDEPHSTPEPAQPRDAELELLEGELVVLDEQAPLRAAGRAAELERSRPPALGAVQAAAVAATGFLAGATAMVLARRWAARRIPQAALPDRPLERWPAGEGPLDRWPLGSTRTYLVSVRLISRPER
jgi:hypothetical protein